MLQLPATLTVRTKEGSALPPIKHHLVPQLLLAVAGFLRQQKVVGAYLEFFGEGASALTLGDRATISNMAPEYGATAAMFFIDEQTITYLLLTGREDAQVRLVETYARHTGLWADSLKTAIYERVLEFDLSGVVRNMAGPSNPHARVATSDLAAKGIAGAWQDEPGRMPDGAVIIAAITSYIQQGESALHGLDAGAVG